MFSGGLRNLWWGLTCFQGGGGEKFPVRVEKFSVEAEKF